MRLLIQKIAIAGIILLFAPIWSPIEASKSASSRGGHISNLNTEIDHGPRITIELDVFSGRPNPSWELRGIEAETLRRMLDQISHAGRTRGPCTAPALGYRGLHLNVRAPSMTPTWHVFEDCVDNNGRFFDDSAREIEAYIFRSMPAQLSKDLATILPQIMR
jgi:hypothetical protein